MWGLEFAESNKQLYMFISSALLSPWIPCDVLLGHVLGNVKRWNCSLRKWSHGTQSNVPVVGSVSNITAPKNCSTQRSNIIVIDISYRPSRIATWEHTAMGSTDGGWARMRHTAENISQSTRVTVSLLARRKKLLRPRRGWSPGDSYSAEESCTESWK